MAQWVEVHFKHPQLSHGETYPTVKKDFNCESIQQNGEMFKFVTATGNVYRWCQDDIAEIYQAGEVTEL